MEYQIFATRQATHNQILLGRHPSGDKKMEVLINDEWREHSPCAMLPHASFHLSDEDCQRLASQLADMGFAPKSQDSGELINAHKEHINTLKEIQRAESVKIDKLITCISEKFAP